MADPTLTLFYEFARNKNLVASQALGPTLGIVRTSEKHVFGATGLLETIAPGNAVFDYDPVTGLSLGLLIEEARTNLALQSAAFSTAPWTNIGTPIINATSAVAPDGTLTANSINDNSGASFEGVGQLMPISSAVATYTFSIYVKKTTGGTSVTFGVNLRTTGGVIPVPNPKVRLNTDTGVFADTNSGINSVEDAGDYWRLITQITTNTANTNLDVQLFAATGANNNFTDAAGIVGITTVWGAQVELGAFPTSYIPTATATVTRNADVISTTDVSWLNAFAGTIFAEYTHLGLGAGDVGHVWALHDNSTARRINHHLVGQTGGTIDTAFFGANTTTQFSLVDNNTNIPADTVVQSAFAWAANDFRSHTNGRVRVRDSVGTIPSLSELAIGYQGITNIQFLNGHLRELRYYNSRRPNQFIEDLSSGLISEASLSFSRNLARPLAENLTRTF